MKHLTITDVEVKLMNNRSGDHLQPDFVKKNPQHTVPFLDEKGFYLSESRAIMQYLVDSRYPECGMLGRFPKRRALIHQRLHFELTTLGPRVIEAYGPPISGTATTVDADAFERLREAVAIVDTYLSKSTFIAGDGLTIADFSYLTWFSTFDVSLLIGVSKKCLLMVLWTKSQAT